MTADGPPNGRTRALRVLSAVMGVACTGIGATHVLFGARSVVGLQDAGVNEDSQERFYGALFAGYGLAWLWATRQPRIPPDVVRFLAATMAAGGVGRLLSMAQRGRPDPFWVTQTVVEFAVPAALAWLADADREAAADRR